MEDSEKRYDGFAVASFVLSILTFFTLLFIYLYLSFVSRENWFLIIPISSSPFLIIAALIFGIIGIVNIYRKNLRGKVFAFIGILVSLIILLFLVIRYVPSLIELSS